MTDLGQILSLVLTGGLGMKVTDALIAGVRDRARAKGRRESVVDVLHRSRFMWRDHAWHARNVAREHGGEDDLDPIPDDPYTIYNEKDQP